MLHKDLLWEEGTEWAGAYEVQSIMERGPGQGPQPEKTRLPQSTHPIMLQLALGREGYQLQPAPRVSESRLGTDQERVFIPLHLPLYNEGSVGVAFSNAVFTTFSRLEI